MALGLVLVGVAVVALVFLLNEHGADDGPGSRERADMAGYAVAKDVSPTARSSVRSVANPPALKPEAHYVPQNDPASPEYDPRAFAMSVESAVDVWKAEPRREPWATRREASIKAWLDEHLKRAVPTANVLDIDCKQQSCKVAVDVDEAHANDLGGRYPIFMLAPFTEASTGENGELVFTLLYRADLVGEAAYQEYLRRTLEQLQAKGPRHGS